MDRAQMATEGIKWTYTKLCMHTQHTRNFTSVVRTYLSHRLWHPDFKFFCCLAQVICHCPMMSHCRLQLILRLVFRDLHDVHT